MIPERTQTLLNVLNNNTLDLELIGELPQQRKHSFTSNSNLFVGGSYAVSSAAELLKLKKVAWNDIDVYISDEKDAVSEGGYTIQNILLGSCFGEISPKCMSTVIHMYDLDCCQFCIYKDMVFGTKIGIEALKKRECTVHKPFMGSASTIERVKKYREKGFKIHAPIPDRYCSISCYGDALKSGDVVIHYPRDFYKTLDYIFNIIYTAGESKYCNDDRFNNFFRASGIEGKELDAYVLRDFKNFRIDTSKGNIWEQVQGLPSISSDFRLSHVHVTNNLIILEFTHLRTRVTYIIDKQAKTGHTIVSIIAPRDENGDLLSWNQRLLLLGIKFTSSEVLLAVE